MCSSTVDSWDMEKSVLLEFKASPTDPGVCQLHIDWSCVKTNIDNLCVLISVENTAESVFSFLSLQSLEEKVHLPLNIDVTSGSFKVYAYGLERTDTPYFYKACASGVRKLSHTGQNDEWDLNLGTHNVHHLGMASLKDIVNQVPDPFSMTHKRASHSVLLNIGPKVLLPNFLVTLTDKSANEMFWLTHSTTKSSIEIPVDMLAAGSATVKVYALQKKHCMKGLKIYKKNESSMELALNWPASKHAPIKLPDLTTKKLNKLLQKATSYVSRKPRNMQLISHLYRNKPPFYYHNILSLQDGIMEKYRKDYNGDPASCINGTIDGLFFSTRLDMKTKQPPNFSFFGAKRLHVPALFLLHEGCNMYFADFYCHYKYHYVSIVVTWSGSQTDDFCKSKLIQLNPADNPFILKQTHHILTAYKMVYVTMSVFVEIFYTEDIDIASLIKEYPSLVYFTRVTPTGRGKSQKYGIPKNKNCKICVL